MDVAFPILIIVAIILLLIILKCLIPSKGAIGEKRVARILEKLPEEKYSSNIPVVYWSQVLDVIRGYENPVIKESDVRRITRLLMASNTDSKETRKDHVKNVKANVKKRQETIASGKCPRCGGDLILRKGKYGPFYGCSNYPKCTCIQNR